MAEYKLHCFSQSGNAYKVAIMLALCGADWEAVWVDFFNGATRDPEWRMNFNAMGEVPVLEHAGRKLTQSGVMQAYLAKRLGKFGSENENEELEILRWMLFDNHKISSAIGPYRFMKVLMKQTPDPAVLQFFEGRIHSALKILNAHLENRDFVAAPRPTIADLSLIGYLYYPIEEHGFDFASQYPHIFAWLERIRRLPGWKAPYELMPGERFMAER